MEFGLSAGPRRGGAPGRRRLLPGAGASADAGAGGTTPSLIWSRGSARARRSSWARATSAVGVLETSPRRRNGAAAAATTVRNAAYVRIFDMFEVHVAASRPTAVAAYRDTGCFFFFCRPKFSQLASLKTLETSRRESRAAATSS